MAPLNTRTRAHETEHETKEPGMAERAVHPGVKETTTNEYRDNGMAAAMERRGIADERHAQELRARAERRSASRSTRSASRSAFVEEQVERERIESERAKKVAVERQRYGKGCDPLSVARAQLAFSSTSAAPTDLGPVPRPLLAVPARGAQLI